MIFSTQIAGEVEGQLPQAGTSAPPLADPAVRRQTSYARSMVGLGVAYSLLAVAFFLFPEQIVSLLNVLPSLLRFAEPIAGPSERFWSTLASAGALTLALLSFFSAKSPQIRGYPAVHISSKLLTCSVFLYLFFQDRPYFAYLAAAGVDGTIAIFVFWKALFARKPTKSAGEHQVKSDEIK